MSECRLQIDIFSAWNTYAISMMSVLEDCGMWSKTDTFQKFMSVTGIAAQFCVDKTCSALPITDYDWINDHTCFMERIGIQSIKYYATPEDPMFFSVQEKAIQAIKSAVDKHLATVAWGIDTGEFGVIYGYDDEDHVFFTKGIGNQNINSSMPVLYKNLGKTFEQAPVLYCEIPQSKYNVDWSQTYLNFLNIYVHEMNRICNNSERFYGLAVYDMIVKAIQEDKIDHFGLKYCIGIFFERKDAILQYLLEKQKEEASDLLTLLIDSFQETVKLYKKLMFEILKERTDGWNYLFQPMNKECYQEIIKVMNEMKSSEKRNVNIANRILDKYSK